MFKGFTPKAASSILAWGIKLKTRGEILGKKIYSKFSVPPNKPSDKTGLSTYIDCTEARTYLGNTFQKWWLLLPWYYIYLQVVNLDTSKCYRKLRSVPSSPLTFSEKFKIQRKIATLYFSIFTNYRFTILTPTEIKIAHSKADLRHT